MTNKGEFKKIIQSTIIRRHKDMLIDLKHYHNTYVSKIDNEPIEEYGIKWKGGSIGLKIYINEHLAEFVAKIGKTRESMTINFYEETNFIHKNKTLIKTMITFLEKESYD